MKHPIRTLEELRAELRLARWRYSVRELERASGVGHTTINQLLGPGELRRGPTAATIRRLSAFLDAQAEADASEAAEPHPLLSRARAGDEREVPVPVVRADAGPVARADAASESPAPAEYWQGVADATLRMLQVASAELRELCVSEVLTEETPRRARIARGRGR